MSRVGTLILAIAEIGVCMSVATSSVLSQTKVYHTTEEKVQLPKSFRDGRGLSHVNSASETSYQIPILEKGNRGMAIHRETFEGCDIEIKDDINLSINGKEIDYEFDQVKNKFYSKYLPYTQYNSLLEMARAIAKHTVEFSHINE